MRRVRCPRCAHINEAEGSFLTCKKCGLSGNVGAATASAPGASEKDPWTITIDLRKANPGNWGPGAKALAVVFVLGLTFVGGGVTGVVFEQARSGVISDLEGAGLVSSKESGSAASTDAPDTGASDPQPTETTTESPADPAPEDPDPAPPASYTPSSELQQFGGNGDETVSFEVSHGLVGALVMYHGDAGFFAVKFKDADGKRVGSIDATYSGKYQAFRYIGLTPGQFTMEVDAPSGSWEIYLDDPRSTDAEAAPHSTSGNYDGILPPIQLQGATDFTLDVPGTGQVQLTAYDSTGARIPDCNLALDERSAPMNGQSFTCNVAGPTTVYIDVRAPRHPDASWTIAAA